MMSVRLPVTFHFPVDFPAEPERNLGNLHLNLRAAILRTLPGQPCEAVASRVHYLPECHVADKRFHVCIVSVSYFGTDFPAQRYVILPVNTQAYACVMGQVVRHGRLRKSLVPLPLAGGWYQHASCIPAEWISVTVRKWNKLAVCGFMSHEKHEFWKTPTAGYPKIVVRDFFQKFPECPKFYRIPCFSVFRVFAHNILHRSWFRRLQEFPVLPAEICAWKDIIPHEFRAFNVLHASVVVILPREGETYRLEQTVRITHHAVFLLRTRDYHAYHPVPCENGQVRNHTCFIPASHN